MKKVIYKLFIGITFLIGFLILFIVVTFLVIIPLANNYRLHRQEKTLTALELPVNTNLIGTHSVCGKLCGNGNGMNYLSTILIESELSLKELQAYYAGYDVVMQRSSVFENDCLEHDEIIYKELEQTQNYDHYYVVYKFTSANFGSIWEWDIRGH